MRPATDLAEATRTLEAALAPEQQQQQTPEEAADAAYGKKYDEAKILELVKELEEDGGKLRQPEERQWQLAWRYYNGKHWGEWNEKGELVDVEDEDIPRLVLNYILHLVQTKLAHLLKSRPILQGLPGRPDERSRNATRLAVRVLEAYWRKLKLPKKLGEALLWALVCGKSFWKVYWDPTLGKEIRRMGAPKRVPKLDPTTGEPLFDSATGEPAFDEQPNPLPPVREGDLCVDVVFPHEILVDAGAMDLERASRLLHTAPKPLNEVLRRWGKALGKEGVERVRRESQLDSGEGDDATRRELESLMAAAGQSLAHRVLVKELWVRADPYDFPRGLRAVVIGGKVVEVGPTPRGYPEIPFIEFDELKTNSFWSTSTARQLLDINQVINIEISQQEHVRQVLRYKTLIPEQGNIDKDAMDRTDTEIVTYWHPFKPEHLSPPNITPHAVEIRNSLIGIIKEIGGSIDVLSGNPGGDVRSGRQTAYLQEYAGVLLSLVAMLVEWSLQTFGNYALQIIQAKVKEERYESFVGRDRRVQVLHFQGADLEGCGEIIVQPSASLLMSRAEKMDRVTSWMEKGWLSPEVGLRLLDLGDFDTELYAEEEQDRQNADEMIFKLQTITKELFENSKSLAETLAKDEGNVMSERYILRALTIEAFPFDNHEIHQRQIDRTYRKTRDYLEADPWKRALADALFEWHSLLAGGGPIETPLNPADAELPSGTENVPGLPPPLPSEGGGAAPSNSEGAMDVADGTPRALKGQPPGGGAVGGGSDRPWLAESGAETADGLPSVPRPPGPGRGPGPMGG